MGESWTFRGEKGRSSPLHRLLFGLVLSLASGILLSGCAGFPFLRETRITFLHINDIYEMAPREGQGGGLARVKTLVDREKKANPNTLLIVSGDILSPSLISSLDQGSSMIEAMNIIGADFAGLGNHDFDFGLGPLRKRIVQSQFKWVATNILEDGGQITGTVVVAMKNIKGVKVGFIGLMDPKILDSFNTPKGIDILEVADAARRGLNILRRKNAELVVAITHMDTEQDLRLAQEVPRIDLIFGGHDHVMLAQQAGRTHIVKSGMNAKYLGRISIVMRDGTPLEVSTDHIEVSVDVPEDQKMAALLNNGMMRLTKSLQKPVGSTTVELNAISFDNRTRETNLGNFIADSMRERMGADIAIINSGAIRSDYVYSPGVLTGKDLFSILPFANVLCKARVMGHVIKDALENSFSTHGQAKGRFLQISGMRITADISRKPGERVTQVEIQGSPLEEGRVYTLALNDYLLQGGDGYTMLENAETLIGPFNGEPLTAAVESSLAAHQPISPQTDGRIRILGFK